MRRILKKVIMLLLIIIISLNINVYASTGGYSIGNIFTDAQNFLEAGNDVDNMINTTALKNTSSFIYKLLYSIGIIVAVAIGIILGIQFMVASAEDKAKIKEALIAYVVGCIVLFGAYHIWKFVTELVQETTTISISVNEKTNVS